MVSNTRLYGATIALVSGLYSLWGAFTGMSMGAADWTMLLLGVIVIGHGVALLTDFADRIGEYSGPLMVVWAVLMLLNQAWFAVARDSMDGMPGPMGDGMGGMDGSMTGTMMGADAGMVALAVLMLVSGLIMASGGDGESGEDGGMARM